MRRRAFLTAAPLLALAACGSDKKSPQSKAPTVTGTGALSGVEVSNGTTPKITVDKPPFTVPKTSVQVVTKGSGAVITHGQNVGVDYLVVNGRTGKQADTTFGGRQQVFTADPQAVLPGIAKGMLGQHVGSRVLVGVPPADGFKSQGNSQLGVKPGDTMLFVMDLRSAHTPLPKADGTPVPPKAGLPTVTLDGKGHPVIHVPHTAPPKDLVVQPLLAGHHATVRSGQTITAQYTGVLWRNGSVFDSSWNGSGAPATFTLAQGLVIEGWVKGLVGQKVGSRMLLVVPPKDGYPNGSSDGTIKKTDTLVFVVDILDAN